MKHKKAFSIPIILAVIVTPIVLITLASQINTKISALKTQPNQPLALGLGAKSIIQAENKAIEYQTYLDLAAKNSAYLAHHILAERGGISIIADCGLVEGVVLWKSKEKECIPSFPSIKKAFADHLKFYLEGYIDIKEIPLPVDNYYFLIENNGKITGFSINSLELPLYIKGAPNRITPSAAKDTTTKISNSAGKYSFKPNIELPISFNFLIYNETIKNTKQLLTNIQICQFEEKPKEECINQALSKITSYPWELKSNPETDIYIFEVKTGYSFPKNNIEPNEVTIKFALYIPDLETS